MQNDQVETQILDPQSLGFALARLDDLTGGDSAENAAITRAVLSGADTSPRRDVVILNAAAALVAGNKANTLAEGIQQATASIDSGKALAVLDNLVAFSQRFTN